MMRELPAAVAIITAAHDGRAVLATTAPLEFLLERIQTFGSGCGSNPRLLNDALPGIRRQLVRIRLSE